MQGYAFDNSWLRTRERLALLEECLGPATVRRMNALGVATGWVSLEVGAGGSSVAQWLSSQVGATGRVVATDIDTRFLDALNEANLEVRQHNLISDELPENKFDLVHSRMVLMHIPARQEILRHLVSALKPGGWILLEEQDIYPVLATAGSAYRQVWTAFMQSAIQAGVAPEWARQLPELLTQHGLREVGAEGDTAILPGRSPMARFWSLTWRQVRERILAAGVNDRTLGDAEAALGDSNHWFSGPLTVAAWGRRSN
jgi:SAM-dependent methyltransferase